jgi:predicted RNase H-like HicB family nuclease
MKEITFNVERDEDSTWLVATWDDPSGQGGITTQGQDLRELQEMVRDAVRCHFGDGKIPQNIRFHFLTDPVLTAA